MYTIKGNTIKISVRNLVEFICNSGDIDNRNTGVRDVKLMQEGTRMHKKIQKSMGTKYHAEVPMKMVIPVQCEERIPIEIEDYEIQIEGRADGVICDLQEDEEGNRVPVGEVIIDEIKTVQINVDRLEEAVAVHEAQAMCYAYIYTVQKNLSAISVQMTYCNPETEKIKTFVKKYTNEEIIRWFDDMLAKFIRWTDYVFTEKKLRQDSIHDLQFPYAYRKGQKNLVVQVYRAITRTKRLFIQAPTGVGKTLSTVFPAVQAMGQEYIDKIFYLTSKTITRTVAQNAYAVLRNQGLHFRTVTLTAKDKICHLTKRECNPVSCPYAKGHFDRVNDAVYDMVTHTQAIQAETILKYSKKYTVCPYELSLDATYWCDGIICDYNYVFDPNACLKRFFGEGGSADFAFLVDEAHNLVERARGMYSAVLKKEDFLMAKRLVKDADRRLAGSLERCNKDLLEMKRMCDTYLVQHALGTFPASLDRCHTYFLRFFEKYKSFEEMDFLMEFFFRIHHFLNMYDCMDEKYLAYTDYDDDGNFYLWLYCVDPSNQLKLRLSQARSTVFFSATLLPVNYYKEMLSGDKNDFAVYAESVFDTNKRRIVVGTDVSSRYRRRSIQEYMKISKYLYQTVTTHPGKYMVFFPSYAFMEQVQKQFLKEYQDDVSVCEFLDEEHAEQQLCFLDKPSIQIVAQSQQMTELDKEAYLQKFEQESDIETTLGFCISGGIFSEGIDLTEESLIGVIIVGTGLPMVCTERELLRRYFDENGKDGYAYAYIYPGMNKVLQAAGRVIRTDKDIGIIELLDDRFLTKEYTGLFPREWEQVYPVRIHQLSEILSNFWENVVQ